MSGLLILRAKKKKQKNVFKLFEQESAGGFKQISTVFA